MTDLPTNLPQHEYEMVTATFAAELLARNTDNRPLLRSTVQRYAIDLKAGRWHYEATAPVVVAADGTLLNGQHVLTAILETGIAIPLLVVRGVSPDVWLYIDNGRKRTLAQELHREEVANSTLNAAAARAIWQYQHGLPVGGRATGSTAAYRAVWDATPAIREHGTDSKRISWQIAFGSPGTLTALRVLFEEADPHAVRPFFELLEFGDAHHETVVSKTIARLRSEATTSRRGSDNELHAALLIKTFNAYRLGQPGPVKMTGKESFPQILSAEEVAVAVAT